MIKIRIDLPDNWFPSIQQIKNEIEYQWWYNACNWWAKRCIADFYCPPRPYRPWDLKVSAAIYSFTFLSDVVLSVAFRSTGAYSNFTNAATWICDAVFLIEFIHSGNLKKWRERVHNDFRK